MTDLEAYSPPELAAALRHEMDRGLPGRHAHRTTAPELAYGRHCGPVPHGAKRAAVLLVVDRMADCWSIPAILRPATMKAHAGQVALPGGLIEPDESPSQTALREFEEELGSATIGIEIIGPLSPVFVFISGFEVTPLLAVSHQPLVLTPSPDEVEEIVRLSVAQLIDPACRGSHLIRRRELAFRAPHLWLAGRQVWGATSLILAEFAELAARVTCPSIG